MKKSKRAWGRGIYGCYLCGTVVMPGTGRMKKVGPRHGKHWCHTKCKQRKDGTSYREL